MHALRPASAQEGQLLCDLLCLSGRLPVAHTCSRELDLPDYSDAEELQQRLGVAISAGLGFGLV
mgnify:CR=1 FL=1